MSALQIHIQNKMKCSQPFPEVLFLSVPPPPSSLQTPAPRRGQCRWNFWSRRPRRPACCSRCHFLSCSRSSASRAASSRGGTCSASPWTSARYFWQKHPPVPRVPLSFLPSSSCLLASVSPSFLQGAEVRLWWPRDHGERHGYRLAVRGQRDSDLVIKAESKVRGHFLPTSPPTVCVRKREREMYACIHTYIHVHMYIYMYVCLSVCLSFLCHS